MVLPMQTHVESYTYLHNTYAYTPVLFVPCIYMGNVAPCEVIPVAGVLIFVVTLDVNCENTSMQYRSERETAISVPSSFTVLHVLLCNTLRSLLKDGRMIEEANTFRGELCLLTFSVLRQSPVFAHY